MEYWKVISGNHDIHTDGLSFAEASNLAMELNDYFPNKYYCPFPDPEYKEEQSAPVYYNTRGVMDGWEDQFDY
jgi:hypothetical protein